MNAYELLTGVGRLYLAATGTTFPDLNDTPSGSWTDLGETQDGVKITPEQKIDEILVDQRTGAVKAVPSEEGLTIDTKLVILTLENLGLALGATVTDTPAESGVIGTREIPLHRGATLTEYAVLFRGETQSPYGASYPAQYELPRAYVQKLGALEHLKNKNAVITISFKALEDLTASAGDEFGRLVVQDAAALP